MNYNPESDIVLLEPNEEAARTVVKNVVDKEVSSIDRFNTGLDNYVYKVQLEDGKVVVARLNYPGKEDQYTAAVYWYKQLEPAHIPMPKLFASNTKPGTIPYMIMEYVPGVDLGDVYVTLTQEEREHIAKHMATIQIDVMTHLPLGPGYGYANAYEETSLYPDWMSVLHTHLDRSKNWITEVGLVDPNEVEKVRQKLGSYADYFSKVKPTPFLHDTTTKNVLVSEGKVVGIVDVDSVCFGDPLFVPALTKMALLSMEEKTDYIDTWCNALNITEEQRRILDLYTAMFCVNFMGEVGKSFNKKVSQPVASPENYEGVARLKNALDSLLEIV